MGKQESKKNKKLLMAGLTAGIIIGAANGIGSASAGSGDSIAKVAFMGSIDQVLTRDIANGAITNRKLAANSVGTYKIIDGSIKKIDIGNWAITKQKLALNSVDSARIVDGSIQTEDLAGSVNADTVDGVHGTDLYTKAQVNALLAEKDAEIAALEARISALEAKFQ